MSDSTASSSAKDSPAASTPAAAAPSASASAAPSWVNIKVPLESLHGQALTIAPLRVTPRTDSASPRPANVRSQPNSPKLPVVPEPASLASMVATNTADGPASAAPSSQQQSAEAVKPKLVYVGFAADIIHHGHINIIQVAAQLGRVIVGLLTDEAIKTYKRDTIIKWEDRKIVVEAITGVDEVVAQHTHDYSDNLKKYKPDFVVHGTDWRAGTQALVRQKCIDLIATWGGQLVEPEYTKDISTTDIIQQCYEYEKQRKDAHEVSLSPSEDYKVQFATQQFLEEFDQNRPLVYVGFATDLVHHGHIRILREAAKHGSVVVGLLTDDAVTSYRRKPIVSFEHRVKILQNIKYVTWVIPQFTLKYGPNLRALRPEFVVHGDDWKDGSQRPVRDEVMHALSEWKGALIEPPSTSINDLDRAIESTCYDRVVTKQQQQAQKQTSAVAAEGAH